MGLNPVCLPIHIKRGEDDMMKEAETGVMQLQAKESQGLMVITRS